MRDRVLLTAQIYVLLLLLLSACPGGKSASIDWSKQPHADIIPRPLGAWAVQPVVRTNFATVYTYAGETVPAWIAPVAAVEADAAIDAELAWSTAHGVPRARGNSGAVIEWYLYYNPTLVAKQTASVLLGYLVITREDGKKVSVVPQPPGPNVNVSGQAQMRTHGDTITRATVWLNVSYYEVARRVYVKQGKSEAEARRLAGVYMAPHIALTAWHEGGHALWGLQDDPRGNTPGLMSYREMTPRPSAAETDVIRWLYP